MGRRPQVVQFYRSVRDAVRHRKLESVRDRQVLHSELIDVDSGDGKAFFEGSMMNRRLVEGLVAQQHPAFCGLASSCVVMQGLGMHMTQRDVFRKMEDEGFPRGWFAHFGFGFIDCAPHAVKVQLNTLLKYDGIPLAAVAALLEAYTLRTAMHTHITEESFLAHLLPALSPNPTTVLLSNYSRPALYQRGTGHFAPVAAYNPTHKKCLLLEVNQNRYPSVWVDLKAFINAVNSTSVGGTQRGYMLVSRA